MADWYVDSGAAGANNGTWGVAGEDAWQTLVQALTYNAYTAGDVIHVRGNGIIYAEFGGDVSIADSGAFGNPIILRGDDGTVWAGDSGGRPILDFAGNATEIIWYSDEYWRVEYLEFRDGEGECLDAYSGSLAMQVHNCTFTDVSHETPVEGILLGDGGIVTNCVIGAKATRGIRNSRFCQVYDTTIDNCATGLSVNAGAFLENVVLGGSIANTSDIDLYSGQIRGRNVVFNGASEVSMAYPTNPDQMSVHIEDYDGVKGAWKAWFYTGILNSIASASTPDGTRAGGSTTVVKAAANAYASAYNPLKCAEFVKNQTGTGTPDVTVYIQPDNADTSVPDTQGADADVWVEVLAWDTATGAYLRFDSRDKAAQDAQVDETWGAIVTENVEVDATGTIIIRVWCKSEDTFYIDPTITVA